MMHLKTVRSDKFPFTPDEFWERIQRVGDFQLWWPWLKHFDGHRLVRGDVWACVVQPPVPYTVRFTVTLDQIIGGRMVTARISGDISGTATLTVTAATNGCHTTLVSDLAPDKQSLRVMSIAARPVVRFGHNWVLDAGVRQFTAKSGQRL